MSEALDGAIDHINYLEKENQKLQKENEGLQKELKDCTEKEGFSITETKRKELIEKLEQVLDILYDE